MGCIKAVKLVQSKIGGLTSDLAPINLKMVDSHVLRRCMNDNLQHSYRNDSMDWVTLLQLYRCPFFLWMVC